jgi:hypothetical protein
VTRARRAGSTGARRGPGRAALWCVALAAVAGCGGATRADAPTEAVPPAALEEGEVGCWAFEENAATEALDLPWGLALMGHPVPGLREPGDRRAAATLDGSGTRSEVPFGSWRPLPGDSVQVGPVAMGSLQLRLAVGEEELTGLARSIGDVAGPWAEAGAAPVEGVVARPVPCPDPR